MESLHSNWSYFDAFSRNKGLISDGNQEKLRNAHVAIIGLGGVGGIYATTMARLGVGHFTIADPDVFEIANTNRQQGASSSVYGQSKLHTMEAMIKDINPTAMVRTFSSLTPENVDEFLKDITVALDGIDFFTVMPRRLLYRECRKRMIPVLSAGPVGFGAAMTNFNPTGMSLEEYFDIKDGMTEREQVYQMAMAVTPLLLQRSYFSPSKINFETKAAPSSVLGTLACANMVGCEAYKVIAGLPYESAPVSWQFDPYVRKFRRCNLWWGNRNPIQLFKKWYFTNILKWN
jgi:molybdopterin/thiamine biosynthesis adenylyltransferase